MEKGKKVSIPVKDLKKLIESVEGLSELVKELIELNQQLIMSLPNADFDS